MSIDLSFVCPVYGSPQSLQELFQRIQAIAAKLQLTYEVILVDDRCPKGSWEIVRSLVAAHPEVVGIRLSRNFGQHPAIYAGLGASRGEWVVVLDCDLQDAPEEIEKLHRMALAGYDVVRAKRMYRQDSILRKIASRLFYRTLSYLTGIMHSAEIGNFGIYHRKVVAALLVLNEDHLYFPTAVRWVGFATTDVEVRHAPRHSGRSSYTFSQLARLGIRSIISVSDKPLQLLAYAGLMIATAAFAVSLYLAFRALVFGTVVPGWASVIASVWLLSGITIFCIGFTGLYIGQILREAKRRPNYIIDEIFTRR